jgi:DNA replication and repair protein RecF
VPILKGVYSVISGSREEIGMEYLSELSKDDFDRQLREGLQRDIALQRTAIGAHRDDFEFAIEGYPLKKFGSQGQQKSFVVSLKLAQFELVKNTRGFKPLLLMDDIFDKLDDKRIARLLEMVAGHAFGQLFVTDARPERTKKMFRNISSEVTMVAIADGKVP